jgi:hypothetical protein
MTAREKWAQVPTITGGLAVLVGGIDPLDGAIVVLAGAALLAAAAMIAPCNHAVRTSRAINLTLTIVGFAAIWIMTALGGIGGATGRSFLWAWLGLPWVAGWSLSFWSHGAPRWLTWLGLLAGGWYLVLPLLAATKARTNPHILWSVLAALGACGLVTIVGCVWRLRQPRPIAGNT